MLIQICLAIITAALVALIVLLIKLSMQMQNAVRQIQTDLNRVSAEVTSLSSSLNEFVKSDLHQVSEKTSTLIEGLAHLVSQVDGKSNFLSLLFKSFGFLSSKMSSSSESLSSKCEAIPQIMKWIASSVSLIKSTKELVKNYEQSK